MGEGEKVMTTGMEEARRFFRKWVDAASGDGQHTVIQRHGKPVAVLVPVSWYIAKGGDPREPLEGLAERSSRD
jgi:prevent-host-death family protein